MAGVCVVVMLVGLTALSFYLSYKHEQIDSVLSDVEARYARLLGMKDVASDIDGALKLAQADLSKAAFGVETTSDRIGTDIQQRVRRMAEASSVDVAGSLALPVKSLAGFEQVLVSVTLDGTLAGLRNVFVDLGVERPHLYLDAVTISATNRKRSDGEPLLSAQVTVSAFRKLP